MSLYLNISTFEKMELTIHKNKVKIREGLGLPIEEITETKTESNLVLLYVDHYNFEALKKIVNDYLTVQDESSKDILLEIKKMNGISLDLLIDFVTMNS